MDIIRPDAGTAFASSEEPRRREHLDRLGYLPEERGLYTKLRVIDVLTYFGAPQGRSREPTLAGGRSSGLERVELPHVSTWKVDRLSKGMSQKVQIAGALLSDPELCVSDELDDRSGSGECSPRTGPAGGTPPERPQRRSSRRTI